MKGSIEEAMAQIDEAYERQHEAARRDWLTRHDAETVDAVFDTYAQMWRTERQIIETRVRNALQEVNE